MKMPKITNPFFKTKRLKSKFQKQADFLLDSETLIKATTKQSIANSSIQISDLKSFLTDLEGPLKKGLGNSFQTNQYPQYLNTIQTIQERLSDLGKTLDSQIKIIEQAEPFINSVKTSNPNIFEKMSVEEHRLAADIENKMLLTYVRAVQIFIFVTVTYISVAFASWMTNHTNLVIPRGLITIVPSQLIKNAQNATKPIESVTTTPQKTEVQ